MATLYAVKVPESSAQGLVDTLNAPRAYDEEYTESDGPLGLGAGTTPADATDLVPLGERPSEAPPQARYLHLSVSNAMGERFRSICSNHNADIAETDPSDGASEDDGQPWEYGMQHYQNAGLVRVRS